MNARPSKRERREAARRARRRTQRIRWTTAVVALVVTATIVVVLSGGASETAGALAPDFELETPDGETVQLADYRGQPVAVTFMHTY